MSKVIENRKSSFSLATKKEIELTHILSITYVKYHNLTNISQHNLYKCCFSCYEPANQEYYKKGEDLTCEDRCYSDFLKVQSSMKVGSELQGTIDDREDCMTDCFKGRKGSTDSIYCIEKCNETFNARLKKTVAEVSHTLDSIL